MSDKPQTPDEKLQQEFNRWAAAGEGPKMEQHHSDITEKTIRIMNLRPGERVLDLGCGSGWATRLLARLVGEDFLRNVNSGKKVRLGRKVAVIGGGSVAIDTARTALRLGAKEVRLVCLECRNLDSSDRMPAQEREIREAEQEGVILHPSRGIQRILVENNRAAGIETMDCLSVRSDDGAFAPRYDRCSLDILDADNVIIAAGQTIDRSAFAGKLQYSGGSVVIDRVSLETGAGGVFAGGDIAGGTADIVSAIGAGKAAAISIDRYLRDVDLHQGRLPVFKSSKEKAPVSRDLRTPEEAEQQARRCLQCGLTIPSVVFKPEDAKRQIVPWDAQRALALWQKRHPDSGEVLPDVFEDAADVIDVPEDTYLRNKLELKPENSRELLTYTTDDE